MVCCWAVDTLICQNSNIWIKYICVTEPKRNRMISSGLMIRTLSGSWQKSQSKQALSKNKRDGKGETAGEVAAAAEGEGEGGRGGMGREGKRWKRAGKEYIESCNSANREVENTMAWKGKAEGRYQAIIINQSLSITLPCFHHSHCGRAGREQALQSLPTQRFWICWEIWESFSQISQERFHSFSLFLTGFCT